MDIKICKLRPEHAEDYIKFFDNTNHDDNVDEHKCYCVCWSNDNCDDKDFSKVENRRKYAWQYVKNKNVQGYFAYCGDKIVGWCNANTKADCLNSESWQRFMDYVPLEEPDSGLRVKSVFCFVIAPEMRRKGIATQLLNCVCEDAAKDGFDIVEAYPFNNENYQTSDFGGYLQLYEKCGFHISLDNEQRLVVRRKLK